jgi:hypothetical protein
VRQALVAVTETDDGEQSILRDWETLKLLNGLPPQKGAPGPDFVRAREFEARAKTFLDRAVDGLKLDFVVPEIEVVGMLLPTA